VGGISPYRLPRTLDAIRDFDQMHFRIALQRVLAFGEYSSHRLYRPLLSRLLKQHSDEFKPERARVPPRHTIQLVLKSSATWDVQ